MKRLPWLAPIAIILLIAAVVVLNRIYKHPEVTEVVLNCASLQTGCQAMLGERKLDFGIDGELKLLKPFEVWAKVEGAKQIQASFDMVGMDMGFNLYTLRLDPAGVYRTKVTLPMCVTGRHDWQLHLDVDGQRFTVAFVTEM